MKKLIYILIVVVSILWIGFRVVQISNESKREVFNVARNDAEVGVPVETITVRVKSGALFEPIVVKNGKAYVSGSRAKKFKIGQKLSEG
ncbi:MAG: hypothetical protein FWG18_03885, partial [Alphaproteobacteria bacterium]|nr:hypothetical protein [Alphaproteobacteria bacterium]